MKKWQRALYFLVIIILIVTVTYRLTKIVKNHNEGFGATSPGTMVQLSTSHVLTEEDEEYYKNVYPKMVRNDILNMTGGDPGPIRYYPLG